MFVYLQSQNRSYRSELPARRVGRSVRSFEIFTIRDVPKDERSAIWSDGRVARQRSAKPCTAVRIRFRPRRCLSAKSQRGALFLCLIFTPVNLCEDTKSIVESDLFSGSVRRCEFLRRLLREPYLPETSRLSRSRRDCCRDRIDRPTAVLDALFVRGVRCSCRLHSRRGRSPEPAVGSAGRFRAVCTDGYDLICKRVRRFDFNSKLLRNFVT